MEIRQLEHLIAAIEEGTLRGAAERSHISQPGLSMSLARLETFLGASLLDRQPRGVTPTPYGDAVYRHAKIVTAHIRHAIGEVEALKGGGGGELRVGIGASFMNRALPRALERLLAARPGLVLHVDEGLYEDQVPRLLAGEMDVAFTRFPSGPSHPQLHYEQLHRRRLLAYLRSDHPLARRRKPPTLAELLGMRWLVPDEIPPELSGPVFRALREAGAEVKPVVQTNSIHFLKRLLLEGDGAAILPEGAVADEVAEGHLKPLPLPELEVEDEVGALYRKELETLPLITDLIEAVREELPATGLSQP